MISYCLPIQKNTCEEVRQTIDSFVGTYDFFEVWLDQLVDLDDAFVNELVEWLGERLILLFRRPWLEPVAMAMLKRQEIMTRLAGSLVWLDLDVSTQREELDWVQEKALLLSLLVSYHNYEETPPDEVLWEYVEEMLHYDANIVKIATYCQTEKDALRLMNVGLSLRKKGVDCIVLGMGEYGAMTRVFGTLWFNKMIFAPPSLQDVSAPGQLSRSSLHQIMTLLQNET